MVVKVRVSVEKKVFVWREGEFNGRNIRMTFFEIKGLPALSPSGIGSAGQRPV